MKIFITGITGFVGERLSKTLIRRGHEVSGLARYSSTRDYYELAQMLPNVRTYIGDVLDVSTLRKALRLAQPDVILNLAAQTSVEYSFQHPEEVYQVNYIGTVNVASVAREVVTDLKKFVHASSVEVYGNQDSLPLVEKMMPKPASPYGVAKTACEFFLKHLNEGYNFPCLLVRNANSYGRSRNRNFVVEHIIQELLSDIPQARMGIPDSIRDFYFIDDEEDFFVKAIESEVSGGEIINTGNGDAVSIEELYRRIEKIMNIEKPAIWYATSPRPFEIKTLTMDVSKAKDLLGWEPTTSLDEGLKITSDYWYWVNKKRQSTS